MFRTKTCWASFKEIVNLKLLLLNKFCLNYVMPWIIYMKNPSYIISSGQNLYTWGLHRYSMFLSCATFHGHVDEIARNPSPQLKCKKWNRYHIYHSLCSLGISSPRSLQMFTHLAYWQNWWSRSMKTVDVLSKINWRSLQWLAWQETVKFYIELLENVNLI